MMPPPRPLRPPEPRALPTWQIGLIVTGAVLAGLLIFALVYRILVILIGEQITQLTIALAVILGLVAMGVDYVTGVLNDREREAQERAAEREGRSL
jgi:predicted tellurium resistance membrane protein TerC